MLGRAHQSDDTRTAAEGEFRRRLAPLLALGDEHPTATELVIDGDRIGLDLGNEWVWYEFDDFPSVTMSDIRGAASAAAVFAGVEFGPTRPAVPRMSCKIPPDLRVSVVSPPVSAQWNMAIRFLRSRSLTLEHYLANGIISEPQYQEIMSLLDERKNLIVSGGTSTGKTTFLRALLDRVSALGDRLIIIEDTPELNVPGRSVLQWSTTIAVDMAELLQQALRHRPDRVIVGEVRGGEALELVRAANTGHDGLIATLHSNGGQDTVRRLHTLVVEGQPNFPIDGIRSAIDYDIHLRGRGRDRRLHSISRIGELRTELRPV